nr:hypothetical protein [Tanacetum cinerariifolium]GFA99008.1 hypothetical protein [Tanacetum cinerariifolium]
MEKEVKILKYINHDSVILVTIMYEVPAVVKEYLGTSLDDTLHKHQKPQKSVADIRKIKMEHARKQNTKNKALYHALMESILKDEDAMDKRVVDRLKKRKPDDVDKDEGPLARLDQGLKARR